MLCFTTAGNLIELKGSSSPHMTQTLIETAAQSLHTYEHVPSERNASCAADEDKSSANHLHSNLTKAMP